MATLTRNGNTGQFFGNVVGQLIPPADPVHFIVSKGDALVAIERGSIPMRSRDIAWSDGFKENVDRVRKAPTPVTLTFRHPPHKQTYFTTPGLPPPGAQYDVMFNTADGLDFEAGPGEAPIVKHARKSSQVYTNFWIRPFLPPHLQNARKPSAVRISQMRALVPACDKGGTSDPQLRVYTNHLNIDFAKLKGKMYTRNGKILGGGTWVSSFFFFFFFVFSLFFATSVVSDAGHQAHALSCLG